MDRPARYTDGTLVRHGDKIRYHQAPGGLLPPGAGADGDIWNYGTAVEVADGEVIIEVERGPYAGPWNRCNLHGHVIERWAE
jgi:hypothetical protein